jgi:uncharacterized membrane protein
VKIVKARVGSVGRANAALERQIGPALICAMDPTKYRMRYLLAILVAAAMTAAFLRHFLHVNAGFSRLEILTGALLAVIGIFLAAIAFRLARRR